MEFIIIATLHEYRNQNFGTRLLEYVHYECLYSIVESNSIYFVFSKFGFETILTSTTWLRLKQASFPVRNIGALILMTKNGDIWMYVFLILIFILFIIAVKINQFRDKIKF